MAIVGRAAGVGVASVFVLVGCVSDGPRETVSEDAESAPVISVTVPPERLTPFCEAMNDLTDQLRSGEEVADSLVVETYRSIADEAPPEISSDFAAVLAALETGAPPPTDPPPVTVATVPETVTSPPSTPSTSPTDSTAADSTPDVIAGSVDEGFAPGTTPAERINNYVTFACRSSQNNPGPPATEPLVDENDG